MEQLKYFENTTFDDVPPPPPPDPASSGFGDLHRLHSSRRAKFKLPHLIRNQINHITVITTSIGSKSLKRY